MSFLEDSWEEREEKSYKNIFESPPVYLTPLSL